MSERVVERRNEGTAIEYGIIKNHCDTDDSDVAF